MHGEAQMHEEGHEGEGGEDGEPAGLSQDEVQVIMGALDMATKTAEAACTPLSKVGCWGLPGYLQGPGGVR